MAKRENEGKKEKKQKEGRKIKRKQYGGLLLNLISVPRTRTRACEGRRIACTCTFAEAGEAAMEIVDNCFGSIVSSPYSIFVANLRPKSPTKTIFNA